MKKFIHDLTDNEKRALIGAMIGVVTIAIIAIMFLGGNKPEEVVSNEKKDPYVQSSSFVESFDTKEDSKNTGNSESSGSKNVWMTLAQSNTAEEKPEEKNVKVTATAKSEHIVAPKENSEEISENKSEENSSIQASEDKPKDNESDENSDNKQNQENDNSSGNTEESNSLINESSNQKSDEPNSGEIYDSGEGENSGQNNASEDDKIQNEEENPENNGWLVGNAVADESPYIKQKLGATTAQQFSHPNENLALDFSNNINLAKNAYVLPTENGFAVCNRALMNLLNLSDEDILNAEAQALGGSVIVKRISKEEKDGLKKEEGVIYSFIEDGDGYIMIKGFPASEDVQKVLSLFSIPSINASTISDSVVTDGKLGDPSKLSANNDLEWMGLSSSLSRDPSKIEMAYNLPLYADSERYKPNGTDIRKTVPSVQSIYYTGSHDINGDGVNEYLVHSTAVGDSGSGIQGYWAIFAPSKQGLVLAALSKYGNGGFVSSENQLYFISELSEENGVDISFQSMKLPMKNDDSDVTVLKFSLVEGFPSKWTGKQLVENYPGCMIVKKDDRYFAVNKEEFDMFMDIAKESLRSAKTNEILKDGKIVNEKITDVAEYLDTIVSVPFGKEWERAISVDKLGEITENLTEDIIQANN